MIEMLLSYNPVIHPHSQSTMLHSEIYCICISLPLVCSSLPSQIPQLHHFSLISSLSRAPQWAWTAWVVGSYAVAQGRCPSIIKPSFQCTNTAGVQLGPLYVCADGWRGVWSPPEHCRGAFKGQPLHCYKNIKKEHLQEGWDSVLPSMWRSHTNCKPNLAVSDPSDSFILLS